MLETIFQKSSIRTANDEKMKDILLAYTERHMPDLELIDFRTSYSVRNFTFKAHDPNFIGTYRSANMRSIIDAVLDTNGCYIVQDGSNIVLTVPRTEREIMYLGNGIDYLATIPKENDITCYIGEDTDGEQVTLDLEKESHLLIAGQTGSGKTNCIHDIIMSLMSRYTKDELIFYMLDPKSDLMRYKDLLSVIETADTKIDILDTLAHVTTRMGKRQNEMKSMKITDWNTKYPDKAKPHIIVIFDEIDSIIAKGVSDKISDNIRSFITQLVKQGRSAGIHLILASQRPVRANLDTNIKSEIKARIALKLDTPTDSRIMLNQGGAEKLKGDGDAYITCGDIPKRMQCAYATWDEVEAAIKELKQNGATRNTGTP